jgi:hypothetical protein
VHHAEVAKPVFVEAVAEVMLAFTAPTIEIRDAAPCRKADGLAGQVVGGRTGRGRRICQPVGARSAPR